ncbi:DNA recombination protein RmuC [Hyphomonas johnsonii]|uniref:DNA recombination protein RmuC homolog n=1 Tax=Hyphomonas johnsonii MHS-2 TaxID=1280950 RepID=A0A059FJY8_9PROT|nr:DNA recombination protein RmuC [Hyphomonas johnsonii]KCZ90803.1 RmuC domain-containing protein [Hyphomonas johnsonii MHS-2]
MKPIVTIGDAGLDGVHLALLAGVILLAGLGWWLYSRAGLVRRDLARAEQDLSETKQALRTQQEVARQAEIKLAEAQARSAEDERKFAEMAQGVLQRANTQFLQLANETFEKHKEGAKGQLQELMKPIGDNFDAFKKRVDDLEKVRTEDKSLLSEQVKAISESLHRNTAETGKLVNALTAPKGGGRWGEMTLRNVMEQAGLSAHCDFSEQVHDATEEGRQRPDAIIRLPGDRQIVIDSKVSLASYMAAVETEDPAQKILHLKAHATSVQRHVNTLASKDYQSNLGNRFDYIAMFIPGENFFAAALQEAPDLIERAMSKQVIVTTPTTLIALAKTVAHLWRQHHQNENAMAAAELGAELYGRMGVMLGHIEKLGKSLNGSVDHFNSAMGSFDKRVLPTLRKFEDMEIAPPNKPLAEPKQIENRTNAPEPMGELDFGDRKKALPAE